MPPCLTLTLSEKTSSTSPKTMTGRSTTKGSSVLASTTGFPEISHLAHQNAKGAEQHYRILLGEMTTNCQEQSQEKECERRMNIPQSKIAFYVT